MSKLFGHVLLLALCALVLAALPARSATYKGHTAAYWFQATKGQHRAKKEAQRALRRERAKNRRLHLHIRSTKRQPFGGHPDELKALCVHGGEGAWTSNTGNGYYGGMQMDRQFASTYGGWAVRAYGLPHLWPISVQIAVSLEAVYSGRGWGPWPTTARRCGLL